MMNNEKTLLVKTKEIAVVDSINVRQNQDEYVELRLPKSIVKQLISFSISKGVVAIHLIFNGKYITALDDEYGADAAVLAITAQSIFLGIGAGMVLGTGLEFGKAIGKKKYKKAGQIARTSWVLTTLVGTTACFAMISTKWLFQLITSQEIAKYASGYLVGFALGAFPVLLVITSSQISFQSGDWYVSGIASAANFLLGIPLSYLYAFVSTLGSFGVGFAVTVFSWGSAAPTQVWLCREKYRPLELYKCRSIKGFCSHFKDLSLTGSKLALQRFTEWGNLLIISILISVLDKKNLSAMHPSLQYSMLLNLFAQGIAHGSGMIIRREREQYVGNVATKKSHYKRVMKTVIVSNAVGLGLNIVSAVVICLARDPLSRFFLSSDEGSEVLESAKKLMIINTIGLVFDAPRIIISGNLRGWNDIVIPVLVSLCSMTLFAIPISTGISYALDNDNQDLATMLFIGRTVSIAVSATITAGQLLIRLLLDRKNTNIADPEITSDSSEKEIVEKDRVRCGCYKAFTNYCCSFFKRSTEENEKFSIDNSAKERKSWCGIM